jgi:serine/threonine-protein kinase
MLDRVSESEQLRDAALQRVGRLVQDKWSLVRLLGVGGSAAVYEAEHRNGRRVAIKMLHAKYSAERDAQRRFLQEAYAANRVEHPDVVQVYDDGVDENGNVFLVSELLRGRSLAELQAELGGTLPPATAVRLIGAALEPLAAAHEKGVVHRDLKPANLFSCDSGAVKLLDFGIARIAEAPSGRSVQTATGSWLGTPAFAAPEQARGRFREVDERSDVWAMGATLFTLLTGQFVYQAETINEQLGLAMTTPARSLASVGEFPAALVRVVDRALEFEQQDRFPNAAAMLKELRSIQGGLSDEPVVVRTLVSSKPRPALGTTSKAIWALVGAGLVLTGYYLTRVPPAASTPSSSADVREVERAAQAPASAPQPVRLEAGGAAMAPSDPVASAPTSPTGATVARRTGSVAAGKGQPPPAPQAATSTVPATNPLDIRE